MKKFRIQLLSLATIVGVAGFFIIHKNEIGSPNKTQNATASSITKQTVNLSNQKSEKLYTTSSGLQYRILNEGSGDENPRPES